MDVFLSYSQDDRKWAEKLRTTLKESGLSVWSAEADLQPGEPWARAITRAVEEAENLVVLVGSATTIPAEEARAILSAAWSEADKRLIPILLGDVRVPTFLRNAGPVPSMTPAIRIANPRRDWKRALADLIQVLKGEAELEEKAIVVDTRKEDRQVQRERLTYIQRVAASFRD